MFCAVCVDLSAAAQQFAKSVAVLGSTEEHMSLSRALSLLSDIETKLYQLHADQADTDFFVLSELVKDYVCVIQSVRVSTIDLFQWLIS